MLGGRLMRAVVFGAGGLLGRHLVGELQRRGVVTRGLDHAACPIDDAGRVRAAAEGATVLLNAAAFTDVDGAERDPERAFAANALGAENVARAAAATGAAVVHVSTDFVFDGAQARPYDEFDLPAPRSLYARSKRAGELLVERAAPRHHVVRVQGLYGDGGRNFSSRLAGLLAEGRRGLQLDRERRVQPTWAGAAARALVDIAASDRFGTWHASCRGAATWHEFALRVAARLGVPPSWEAVPSAALALPAHRPANCLLEHRRLALYGLPPLPTWEEALDEYLDTLSGFPARAAG
jgi:dTDP-4-dehydrorhamnose reductase